MPQYYVCDDSDIENDIPNKKNKEDIIIEKLKIKKHTIRVHENFDDYFTILHKIITTEAFKNDEYKKYKRIKKNELFTEIFKYSSEIYNSSYIKWTNEYMLFSLSVLKYNYENNFPYISLLKGRNVVKCFYLNESDVDILTNLTKEMYVYKINEGDILLLMLALFSNNMKCASEYGDLSELIINKWNNYISSLSKIFYDTNIKIINDLNEGNYPIKHLDKVISYINFVVDFTYEEIKRCEDTNYSHCLYVKLMNDLYDKIEKTIIMLSEKKDNLKLVCNDHGVTFDIDLLENIKRKMRCQ